MAIKAELRMKKGATSKAIIINDIPAVSDCALCFDLDLPH